MAVECLEQQDFEPVLFRKWPGAYVVGNDALSEIVRSLEMYPLPNSQFTARPQRGRHPFGGLEVPPSAASSSFHIGRAEGALLADAVEEVPGHVGMLADDVTPPGVPPELAPAKR